MKIGYVRVSTQEQNTIRQEVMLSDLGVDEIYIDKASGKTTHRPELQKMMDFVRQGDTVVVESISRFARNTRDLLEPVEQLTSKNVEFISKKESIDTSTPTGKFMLTVFGAVAELEREYILQRQREGIEIAKSQGVYTGRKPIERPEFEHIVALWRQGEFTKEAMRRLDPKWISTGLEVTGNNKREAKRIMQSILADLETQNAIYSTETPFLTWIDKWMEQKKQEVRLNTWECYQFYLEKHIRPYFSPKRLALRKLTPQHLQDYYNAKLRDGQSICTLKKHNAIIHGALQEAVKKRMLTFNPADQVTFPRQNKQDRFHGTTYTAEQAVQLLEAFRGDVLEPAVIRGLCYGLRKSEAIGLCWSDIDFEAGTLIVQKTRMKTLIEHEQTKSAASKRILYLMPDTITYLRQLRQQQEENHRFLEGGYIESDHICVWPDGRPVSPDYVSQHFKKVLVKNDLQPIRFHDLRHTAGSLLMNNGASAKQVQEFLGHEKASTTLDIYTHIDTEAKQRTAFSMEQALKAGK